MTGAGGGIGISISHLLASRGASLVLTDIDDVNNGVKLIDTVLGVGALRVVQVFLHNDKSDHLHACASGKLFLSILSPENLHAYIRDNPLIALTDKTIVSEGTLISELELIRRNGYKQWVHGHCSCGCNLLRWNYGMEKIAVVADSYNLSLLPHYFSSIHFHLGMAFPGTGMIEVVSTDNRNNSFHLIAGTSYEVKDGVAFPKHLPGIGLTIDESFVETHTVKLVSTGSRRHLQAVLLQIH